MRKLTILEQACLEDLAEHLAEAGHDMDYITDFVQGMAGLLIKDMVMAEKTEDGEYCWNVTDSGKAFVEKHGDLLNVPDETTH